MSGTLNSAGSGAQSSETVHDTADALHNPILNQMGSVRSVPIVSPKVCGWQHYNWRVKKC